MKRLPKENYQQYRESRKRIQYMIKQALKGRIFHLGPRPYRKQIPPKTTSFTENLRNQKGYQQSLIGRFRA